MYMLFFKNLDIKRNDIDQRFFQVLKIQLIFEKSIPNET